MLDRLRTQVAAEARDRRSFRPSRVSRTIYVPLTRELYRLRSLWHTFFPRTPELLDEVQPWLEPTEDLEAFSQAAERACRHSFEIALVQQLSRWGVSLRPLNLILVLGDLNDRDFAKQLSERCAQLEAVVEGKSVAHSPFFWVGLFLADTSSPPKPWPDLSALCRKRFTRIFLCDSRNGVGGTLTATDRQHLLLHAIRYLERAPESMESEQRFAEWLQSSSPDEGFCGGFGGCSVFFPIEPLVEMAAARLGATLFNDSLLSVSAVEQGRHSFYLSRFLREITLVNRADLESQIRAGIADPLRSLDAPARADHREEALLSALAEIDVRIPMLASQDEASLGHERPERLTRWNQALEDYLDSIITSEAGGLVVARQFLENLAAHLQSIARFDFIPAAYADPAQAFSETRRALDRTPEGLALATRGAVAAAASAIAASKVHLSTAGNVSLMLILPACFLGYALVLRHAAHVRLERALGALREAIRAKWEASLAAVVSRAVRDLLKDFTAHVDRVTNEVQNALTRAKQVSDWFHDEHSPALPEASALFWPVLQSRADLLAFCEGCHMESARPPAVYLAGTPGRFLWRRLAQPGTDEPNAFEQDAVERAALVALSDCRHLLDMRLIRVLAHNEQRGAEIRQHLRLSADPYLVLRGGSGEPDSHALLEADSFQEEALLDAVRSDIEPHVRHIRCSAGCSPFLLSFTVVLERVNLGDIFRPE